MQLPRTYLEDPDFKMPQKFLAEAVYTEAMEAFVLVNVDVLFVDREHKTVYLAKRVAKPMPGFWMIGGRMYAGEDQLEAIRRCVERETSLKLSADRFEFLNLNRYLWKTRAQEPQERGSDNLCFTFIAELTPEERLAASSHLDPDEYDVSAGIQEFDEARLESLDMHQALIDLYRAVFPST